MAPKRVLIVDDDSLVRINTAEILAEVGFDVVEARDADDALAVLDQDDRIDLVCTDVNMPGELDGIELTKRIGKLYPEIEIIVMSGYRAYCGGPSDVPFIAKPFRDAEFVGLVRDRLGVLA